MLGMVYGLECFHHYVFGRHVIIHSDHKLLEAISNKNLANAPPRLARMLLRTQRYNCTIIYKPGKDVPIADALSRILPLEGEELQGINVEVHHLITLLHASPAWLDDGCKATSADTTLSAVADIIQRGWPTNRTQCTEVALPFWNYRDELGIQNGVLLKGTRIIIPKSLQHTFLQQLHAAHQGIEKSKLLARIAIFWVGINKDIENLVGQCFTCQKHQNAQQKEPLQSHEVPP